MLSPILNIHHVSIGDLIVLGSTVIPLPISVFHPLSVILDTTTMGIRVFLSDLCISLLNCKTPLKSAFMKVKELTEMVLA